KEQIQPYVPKAKENHERLQLQDSNCKRIKDDLKKKYFELCERIDEVDNSKVTFESNAAIEQERKKWDDIYNSIPFHPKALDSWYDNYFTLDSWYDNYGISSFDQFETKEKNDAEEACYSVIIEFRTRCEPYVQKLDKMTSNSLELQLAQTQHQLTLTQRKLSQTERELSQKSQNLEEVASGLTQKYVYIMQQFGSDSAIILEQANAINALLEEALNKAQESIVHSSRNTLTFTEGSKSTLIGWVNSAVKEITGMKMNQLTDFELTTMLRELNLSDRMKIIENSPYKFLCERENKIGALISALNSKIKDDSTNVTKINELLTSLRTAQMMTISALKAVEKNEIGIFNKLIHGELLKAGTPLSELDALFGEGPPTMESFYRLKSSLEDKISSQSNTQNLVEILNATNAFIKHIDEPKSALVESPLIRQRVAT
ncbi:MAG: hypothetical protein AB7V32_06700, partial [Candidatus Berkiella sp.]